MQFILNSGHRFSCLACGRCCRTTAISLTPAEAERLAAVPPATGFGPTTQRYSGGAGIGYRLFPRTDGSCPYLGDDNLCSLHVELGEESKPLACKLFPFSFLQTPRGIAVSLRFSCPCVASGQGEPLRGREDEFRRILATLGETVGIRKIGDALFFDGLRELAFTDAKKVLDHQLALLDSQDAHFLSRAAAVVEFTELIAASSVTADTRHRYWQGLRDGLQARMASNPVVARTPAAGMDRLFFRQTAYRLAGTSSPAWLRKGVVENLARRTGRMFKGIRYTIGSGTLGHASFHESVDDVLSKCGSDQGSVLDPFDRFFRHSLATFSAFGAPGPMPDILHGFRVLSLALPYGIWFARSASKNANPTYGDAVEGVVRLADALSLPPAWTVFGRGIAGWIFSRPRIWEKLASWAAGVDPGDPLRFPPGVSAR